jgi:transposase
MANADEMPRDVDALIALVLVERAKVVERDQKIGALEHTLHLYSKWLWGPRTEKRVQEPAAAADHTWLPFADLLDAAQRVADRHGVHGSLTVEASRAEGPKTRAKRRTEFPEHLPRVRTTIEVPEADRLCCGKPMVAMGLEISRELERIETAIVHEIARTKYCCRTCQMQVLTAPGPTRSFPKGLLGANWLAHLVVERFGNHMPYHRLEKKYEAEGLSLSRTVLCRSTIELGESFEKVYAALGKEVAEHDVVFGDETSVRVQESKEGGAKRAWVWLFVNKDGDHFYDFNESRGRDSPGRVLEKFNGYLHDDGYCVYESALDPARVTHVACWAHVRRKFVDAMDKDPVLAGEAIAWIAKLYAIDSEARKRGVDLDEIGALRREQAPAILTGFKEWLDVRKTQVLPQSGMGGAIRYTLGRWDALGRFVEDGRLELDNNRAERGLRAVAVGRKNWMQVGNERGGKTAMVFYSLIATCKARGINPVVYLHDAMLRLAEGADPATLTPRQWQEHYSAEVAQRRGFVLAQIAGQLGTRS